MWRVSQSISCAQVASLDYKKVFEPEFIDFFFLNRSAYAKNPFDNVSAEELQEYQRIIDSKSRQGDGEWL